MYHGEWYFHTLYRRRLEYHVSSSIIEPFVGAELCGSCAAVPPGGDPVACLWVYFSRFGPSFNPLAGVSAAFEAPIISSSFSQGAFSGLPTPGRWHPSFSLCGRFLSFL